MDNRELEYGYGFVLSFFFLFRLGSLHTQEGLLKKGEAMDISFGHCGSVVCRPGNIWVPWFVGRVWGLSDGSLRVSVLCHLFICQGDESGFSLLTGTPMGHHDGQTLLWCLSGSYVCQWFFLSCFKVDDALLQSLFIGSGIGCSGVWNKRLYLLFSAQSTNPWKICGLIRGTRTPLSPSADVPAAPRPLIIPLVPCRARTPVRASL